MTIQPNIGTMQRVAYVLLGAGMIAAALLVPRFGRTEALLVGVAGGLAVLSGATGF